MPNRMHHTLKRAVLACFALMLTAVSAAAAEDALDFEWRKKLQDFELQLQENMPPASVQAKQMIADAGLGAIALPDMSGNRMEMIAPSRQINREIEAKTMDVRLSLGLISQIYGAKDNLDVMYALRGNNEALVINSGDVTLADIFAQLNKFGLQTDGGQGRNLLRVPVIIWGGATLRMGPEDDLIFSRSDGAFLINFGRLEITGSTVTTEGSAVPEAPDFIPFFANAGGASVRVRNANFVGLGFGNEPKFSGFSVVRNPLLVRKDEVVIEDSTFMDVVSVAISMADNALVRNNRIHDSRGASLAVTHSVGARILGNLITGDAPTNAIRLFQGSSRGLVAGNVVMGGSRAGIAVRNDSHRTVVRNNVVWKRRGGGISVSSLTCGIVEHNLVMDNHQKGIEVRAVKNMLVQDNIVIANRYVGIWITDQLAEEPILIADNVLISNGAGLASATGERMVLTGNDFSRQFPRFFAGDLSFQGRLIAVNLDGSTPMILTAGGPLGGPLPNVACDE